MGRIYALVDETELETDSGKMTPGVIVSCLKCGHETESFGTGDASVKRCLALLREECPENEANFYVEG